MPRDANGLTPKQARFVHEYLIDPERFWGYVDQSAGPDACWPWTAAKDANGYGRFHVGKSRNSTMLAHRVAFGLEHGELAPVVRHSCDNPPCCNPAHHQAGTHLENNRDMVVRGRHCSQRGTGNNPRREQHPAAKLTMVAAATIRERFQKGDVTQRALASQFGVCQRTVAKVVLGLAWV